MLPTFGGNMNFEKMIDAILARKIKKARKSMKLTQEQFCERYDAKISIDKFRLSNLENGKRTKKKNPHFLTDSYIEFFAELLEVKSETFLFGEVKDRLDLIKLMILNIFMNGDSQSPNKEDAQIEQVPIFDVNMNSDKEFFRLAMFNLDSNLDEHDIAFKNFIDIGTSGYERNLQEDRNRLTDVLMTRDAFFYNGKNAKLYTLLMSGESLFAEQSSIILKCLFGNFDFASDFLNRRDNGENFNFEGLEIGLRKPSEAQFYIDNYLNAQGMFSANAINWKETSFKLFITAFNEFIECYINDFFSFFEEKIFSKSLKQLSNAYVNKVFSGDEFTDLLNKIYLKDQFKVERMVGHNFSRVIIQKFSLIRNNSERLKNKNMSFPNDVKPEVFYNINYAERSEDKYTLNKYLYDYENMTVLFANSGQKYPGGGLYLPSYFKITPL